MTAFFMSCEKDTNLNRMPSADWEKWQQQLPDGIAFFSGSTRSVEFKNDSFRTEIFNWTDACGSIIIRDSLGNIIDVIDDPCTWTYYAKGTFMINNDSIFFSGKLYDSTYTVLQTGSDNYYEKFLYLKNNDTTITLNPDRAAEYSHIVLRKR